MSKQRPDAEKLANELSGASAFFRSSARPMEQPQEPRTREEAVVEKSPTAPDSPVPKAEPDVMTSRRQSVTTSPVTSSPTGFDINRPTTSRDSLRLSMDETKALDELRASLKWDFDLTVSKNDICRAALHWLLEDFVARGEKSLAVTRLRRKQTSR